MEQNTNSFDFFDDIYCICISSREEKKRKAEEQFKQLGIFDRVEFFEAILSEPYWDGCRESHKECVRRAKEKGARNVLIFEEDVLFLHKDHKALEKCLDDLSKTDWDQFRSSTMVLKPIRCATWITVDQGHT